MSVLPVKIKLLNEKAQMPRYAKPGDAGMDLVATSREIQQDKNGYVVMYGTGLSLEIPEGFVGLIYPRSSIYKTALSLANSTGVVDSKYRGEVKVCFRDLSPARTGDIYKIGDRIAQLMIVPYPQIELQQVEELSETERGEGGFGHTGE